MANPSPPLLVPALQGVQGAEVRAAIEENIRSASDRIIASMRQHGVAEREIPDRIAAVFLGAGLGGYVAFGVPLDLVVAEVRRIWWRRFSRTDPERGLAGAAG